MNKIDTLLPEIELIPTIIIVTVIGIVFQLAGSWVLMIVAGFIGALLVRSSKKAFIAGFVGIALAWTVLFSYLILAAQALAIADLFIGLLGLDGLGWLVIVISVCFGSLLGGFGALFGRALIETLDDLMDDGPESEKESSASPPEDDTE
ncbi:MAG: hypothetical protein GF411_00680 [Candidatus Lokiarchaeota archaeon]|nr:hypothetical protein [Candidatus Lokiarchaeota archaeon]